MLKKYHIMILTMLMADVDQAFAYDESLIANSAGTFHTVCMASYGGEYEKPISQVEIDLYKIMCDNTLLIALKSHDYFVERGARPVFCFNSDPPSTRELLINILVWMPRIPLWVLEKDEHIMTREQLEEIYSQGNNESTLLDSNAIEGILYSLAAEYPCR